MTQAGGAAKPFDFVILCRLNSTLEKPLYLIGQFDSPAPGVILAKTKPQLVEPGKEFQIQSTSFAKIRNNQIYQIRIKAYSDASCTQLVDEVTQSVKFSFPPKALSLVQIEDNVL